MGGGAVQADEGDDPELAAAIAASLEMMELDDKLKKKEEGKKEESK